MCGSGSRRLQNTEPIQIRIYNICLKDFDFKKFTLIFSILSFLREKEQKKAFLVQEARDIQQVATKKIWTFDRYTSIGSKYIEFESGILAQFGAGSRGLKLLENNGTERKLLVVWVFEWWIFVFKLTHLVSYFSYFYRYGSGSWSIFRIRIRIHKVPDYGSNLDPDPHTLTIPMLNLGKMKRW